MTRMLPRLRDVLSAWLTGSGAGYPLSLADDREYPVGWTGPVHVWDIDQTYLATRLSMRSLLRVPIEFAVDKQAVPGMPEVLRGLRRGPGPGFACTPLYFVSAVIRRRMQIDGVEADGLVFKDWAGAVRGLRPGRLREQVGFKVCALLAARLRRPGSVEYLYGDDTESDALAYHLYGRIVNGEMSCGATVTALADAGVQADDRACVRDLVDRVGVRPGAVERAFIHLAAGTDPGAFEPFAPRLVPVRGAVQLAIALQHLGLVDDDCVRQAISVVEGGTVGGVPMGGCARAAG